MGRKADLEALQRVQNEVMMWIGGEGRRAFRIERAMDRMKWLEMGQTAAKASLSAALRAINSKQENGLQEKTDKSGKMSVDSIDNFM